MSTIELILYVVTIFNTIFVKCSMFVCSCLVEPDDEEDDASPWPSSDPPPPLPSPLDDDSDILFDVDILALLLLLLPPLSPSLLPCPSVTLEDDIAEPERLDPEYDGPEPEPDPEYDDLEPDPDPEPEYDDPERDIDEEEDEEEDQPLLLEYTCLTAASGVDFSSSSDSNS